MSTKPDLVKRSSAAQLVHPGQADFWHDEDGSLRVVARIVRYPCCAIWTILTISLLMTMLAFTLFTGFASGGHDYNLADIKAINFDSLQLGSQLLEEPNKKADTTDRRLSAWEPLDRIGTTGFRFGTEQALNNRFHSAPNDLPRAPEPPSHHRTLSADSTHVDTQSVSGTPILMSYEAAENIFTPDGLKKVKSIEDIIRADAGWGDFCFKVPGATNGRIDPNNCSAPISSLNMFYASSWNSSASAIAEATLATPVQKTNFNRGAFCVLYSDVISLDPAAQFQCETLKNLTGDDGWADVELAVNNLGYVLSTWDGQGE
jgi:hypothetical protein